MEYKAFLVQNDLTHVTCIIMQGDGFLSVSFAQNTPFFEKITNQIFRLNYAQLIFEPVQSESKRLCTVTVNSTSVATTWFSLLKVLSFRNHSLD